MAVEVVFYLFYLFCWQWVKIGHEVLDSGRIEGVRGLGKVKGVYSGLFLLLLMKKWHRCAMV